MLLEEKQIPYNVKKALALSCFKMLYQCVKRQVSMSCYGDKPPDFLALQPNGQIPVAVIDGTVLRSSDSIIERVLQMPGASPTNDEQLDPFDHPQSTSLGLRFRSMTESMMSIRSPLRSLLRLERMLFSSWLGWLCRGGGRADFERTLRKAGWMC